MNFLHNYNLNELLHLNMSLLPCHMVLYSLLNHPLYSYNYCYIHHIQQYNYIMKKKTSQQVAQKNAKKVEKLGKLNQKSIIRIAQKQNA